MDLDAVSRVLTCPDTRKPLHLCTLEEAEARLGERLSPIQRVGAGKPIGRTPTVLVREEPAAAFPVVDDIPVMLLPELLVPDEAGHPVDVTNPRYREAYEEMEHYSAEAERDDYFREAVEMLESIASVPAEQRRSFPEPEELWIDAPYDGIAQSEAFAHLRPLEGGRFLQVGGKGGSAMKLLLAGADEVWLASPMISEVRFGRELARALDSNDSFNVVSAVGEQMPFPDAFFDGIYSGGCVHHMVTEEAMPEMARVLKPGGRFAAVEPWRAPFYDLGITIFGKREEEVHCIPLDPGRCAPFARSFAAASMLRHGVIARYPLIALEKVGVKLKPKTISGINHLDERLALLVPPLRRLGGSVSMLGTCEPS